tara:strand:+ start:41 stop:253 length:213 start_codon:yes stop_codon:yes gene_type:complete
VVELNGLLLVIKKWVNILVTKAERKVIVLEVVVSVVRQIDVVPTTGHEEIGIVNQPLYFYKSINENRYYG